MSTPDQDAPSSASLGEGTPLPLIPNEVHLWRIPLSEPVPSGHTLSSEEQQRKNRFHFPRDRDRFVSTHVALRDILSRYTNTPPSLHSFLSGTWGKPSLAPPHADLHFNLSHSHQLALLALQRDSPLGVDLEVHRSDLDFPALTETILAPKELTAFQSLAPSEQMAPFFFYWTAKEAVLKALGTGLSINPKTVEVELTSPPHGTAHVSHNIENPTLILQQLTLAPSYTATLATFQNISRLRFYDYS